MRRPLLLGLIFSASILLLVVLITSMNLSPVAAAIERDDDEMVDPPQTEPIPRDLNSLLDRKSGFDIALNGTYSLQLLSTTAIIG